MNKYTRGSGLLERFLTKQRAKKAHCLIATKSKRERILDIGCGSFPYFLMVTDFKEKYGIDPAVKTSLVKTKLIKLIKSKIDGKNLKFKDNYFDVVTMLAVFEHIDEGKLEQVLKDIYRILKKDGIFIITTPAPWADKLLHQMSKLGFISKVEIHEHKHNHSRVVIENKLFDSGFSKNKVRSGYFEIGFNMWFVAEK